MPASENGDQQFLDDFLLADDRFAEFLDDAAVSVVESFEGGEIAFDARERFCGLYDRGWRRTRGGGRSRRLRRRFDRHLHGYRGHRWRLRGPRSGADPSPTTAQPFAPNGDGQCHATFRTRYTNSFRFHANLGARD